MFLEVFFKYRYHLGTCTYTVHYTGTYGIYFFSQPHYRKNHLKEKKMFIARQKVNINIFLVNIDILIEIEHLKNVL